MPIFLRVFVSKLCYLEQTRESTNGQRVGPIPSESGDEGTHVSQPSDTTDMASEMSREGEGTPPTPLNNSSCAPIQNDEEPVKPRRPAKGSEPFEKWERDEMEKLLGQLNGHLGMAVSLDAH